MNITLKKNTNTSKFKLIIKLDSSKLKRKIAARCKS